MKKSYYFADLAAAYDAEMQDLLNDSEGNSALKARLREKRQELKALLPMIAFSPEMVVPVFHEAFAFTNPKGMAAALACMPDDDDFPNWETVSTFLTVNAWAAPHVTTVLTEGTGDAFMVTAACLEFIRQFDSSPVDDTPDEDKAPREGDDDDEGEDMDLAEAGDDWLGQQGFDSLKS